MIIYIGADHRGFVLKEKLKAVFAGEGYDIEDCGATEEIPGDDYATYAAAVAEKIAAGAGVPGGVRGIVACGSGAGADIVANKFAGVRSVLGVSPDQVMAARHDDDVNILALAADFTEYDVAVKMARTFLATPFAKEEKYERRLEEIRDIEKNKNQ